MTKTKNHVIINCGTKRKDEKMIDKKIDITNNREVWVYKGYKITCPQCGNDDLTVYNHIFDTCEVRADCKKCELNFSVHPVYEWKKRMSQLKLEKCFSDWIDLQNLSKKKNIYKVLLLDKDSSTHPAKECFKTKCTEAEIRELVGNLNSYNNSNEKQYYEYYLMTTEGE